MTKENLSTAIGNISDKYLMEVMDNCSDAVISHSGEVIRMKHRKRTGKRILTIAAAACLILVLGISSFAFSGIKDAEGEMSVSDFFNAAFGSVIGGHGEFNVSREYTDGNGNTVTKVEHYPAFERIALDPALARELIGDYAVAINKGWVSEDGKNEIILRDFIMDENGVGVLSYEVSGENHNNVNFGWVNLYHGQKFRDSRTLILCDEAERTTYMMYISPFDDFDGKNLEVHFRTLKNGAESIDSVKLNVESFVPAKTFESFGLQYSVSPLGMVVPSSDGNCASVVITYKDGSDYVVKGESAINAAVISAFEGKCAFSFNRLVDTDSIDHITVIAG